MEMVTNSPFPDSDNLIRLLVTKSLAKSDSDWGRRKENVNVLIIATVIPSSLGLRFCLWVLILLQLSYDPNSFASENKPLETG